MSELLGSGARGREGQRDLGPKEAIPHNGPWSDPFPASGALHSLPFPSLPSAAPHQGPRGRMHRVVLLLQHPLAHALLPLRVHVLLHGVPGFSFSVRSIRILTLLCSPERSVHPGAAAPCTAEPRSPVPRT